MTQRTIRTELETKINTWALSKNIPVSWENVSFEKPDNTFIEVFIIPATTLNPNVTANRNTNYGMLQINIHTKSGAGTKQSELLAQELIELFPVVPKSGTVSIEQTGSILNAMYDAQWRILPVRFRYRQENY